jgi:hypothetical protein
MASFSIYITNESTFQSEFEEDVQQMIYNCDILECNGISCYLWMTKCMFLHNDNGVAVVEGIFIV